MANIANLFKPRRILSQLRPFNEYRFDIVMSYFANRHRPQLTQYDMMKLHVMTDIFHTLETAAPMIGGSVEPWKHGPVVKPAYDRVNGWARRYDKTGTQPEFFRLVEQCGNANRFEAAVSVDDDDLSPKEVQSMETAWQAVGGLLNDWAKSREYFHNPRASFIGKAWAKASEEGKLAIDWNDIVDAFDEFHRTDHSHIKKLMVL